MTRPAAPEPAPDVAQSLLHAWAAQIVSAEYSDAVSLKTLAEMWQHRRRAQEAAVVCENAAACSPSTPAWPPDEIWPRNYQRHPRGRQHDLGEFFTSPPPSAA
ncbi:hypothetical protein [Amycolatopsis lurida]|uniref:hypothetical protein n=1 Tax=Amycolatopsis lurida TaxID=31959 RepID=UPI0036557004